MKLLKLFALLVLLAATFAGGYVMRASKQSAPAAGQRRVLYYIDPMHPAYTSDKPGVAPDCGMQLEPVYADGGEARQSAEGATAAALSPARPVRALWSRVRLQMTNMRQLLVWELALHRKRH